jgi:ubiquinone/menaquinone biosynthesis C-methylase UbiE
MTSQSALTRQTRAHYERFPFVQGGSPRIQKWARRLLVEIPELTPGSLVLDVGCGSGEVAAACVSLGMAVCAVDLTSVAIAAAHRLDIAVCQGDALRLPFGDRSFDQVIAMGVLHHTAECSQAFAEAARVSRRTVIALLYSKYTPYHLLYRVIQPFCQRVDASLLERMPTPMLRITRFTARHLTGQVFNDDQLRRLLADQFWTPHATFHTRREVARWAEALGMRLVRHRRYSGYSGLYVVRHIDPR